ncbi:MULTISPECIES: DUF2087 domain-containing protein [unclassified Fusibacter]|uniref:DUF2087 domain-containing protein n=1 Tax=unclassified Fusibacter TaxID=2624464 RepID=UPI0010136A1A|nr:MULTISPECIES: DUF2087 domain-containing protein [unclassified Fusibacter]MCK8060286.1 DUF2087 domain-containing protein [Fusibacter sp. A2]NPE20425.1 DUF2087 domain-containing protein [Fusibacter sp. A1]RXV63630.1 DUF2087 domain-containing protein [Fusibacter sp. A1]
MLLDLAVVEVFKDQIQLDRFLYQTSALSKELNERLKTISDDIARIRRYLIQYGFFDRPKDCRLYWIKK